MSQRKSDSDFDIAFYESVLRRAPGYATVIELLGGLYTKQGRIRDGLKMDRRLVKLQPDNPTAQYNLACSLALLGKRSGALQALAHAIELGYHDSEWMLQDPDLASLRETPCFAQFIASIQAQD